MKINRLIQRITFYPIKKLVDGFAVCNSNLYTKLYCKLLRLYGMKINGDPLYIHPTVKFDDFNLITLSDDCIISFGVVFLTHDHSHQIAFKVLSNSLEIDLNNIDNPLLKPIVIGKNSFIGARCLLLPGTKIGNNCIIAAGSIVHGEIPDGSVISTNQIHYIGKIEELGKKWLNKVNIYS